MSICTFYHIIKLDPKGLKIDLFIPILSAFSFTVEFLGFTLINYNSTGVMQHKLVTWLVCTMYKYAK